MGFFDNLTGGKTRSTARKAEKKANALYDQGLQDATATITQGELDQIAALVGGYDKAMEYLNAGYDKAELLAASGNDQARADLNAGYDKAVAAENDFLTRANQYTDPYIQAGQETTQMYLDMIGANGEEAQRAAIDSYVYSPATELNQKATQRALNARGQSSSGRAYQAAARINQEDWDRSVQRLGEASARGQNVAQNVASLTSGTGARIGGYEADRGRGLAGLTGDQTNKLVELATGRGSALGNIAATQGVNIGNIKGNTANTLANLQFGTSQLKANNAINTANTVGGTYGTGLNNLLNIAGTGAKLFAAYNGIPSKNF